jgi:hypothetical protein
VAGINNWSFDQHEDYVVWLTIKANRLFQRKKSHNDRRSIRRTKSAGASHGKLRLIDELAELCLMTREQFLIWIYLEIEPELARQIAGHDPQAVRFRAGPYISNRLRGMHQQRTKENSQRDRSPAEALPKNSADGKIWC